MGELIPYPAQARGWRRLDPAAEYSALDEIGPAFDDRDPRPAREQWRRGYGLPWKPLAGFSLLRPGNAVTYEGVTLLPLFERDIGAEVVRVYALGLVAIEGDGRAQIAAWD